MDCLKAYDGQVCLGIVIVLCSELDARLADVATGSHARQSKGSGEECRNRGSLRDMGNAWSSPHSQHDHFRVLG